jgi:hypothetical protein
MSLLRRRGSLPPATIASASAVADDTARESVEIVSASANLGLISHQLRAVTEDQTAQVSEMRVAVSDLAHGATRIAERAASSAAIASRAVEQSERGAALVRRVVEDVENAVTTATASMEMIDALTQRVLEVGSIASTIDTIAARTNLLALNAAIEAARAGEHGRGFAVVAGEVSKLANATAEAASTIGAIVAAISRTTAQSSFSKDEMASSAERMRGGIDNASAAGVAFEAIAADVEVVSAMVAEVSATAAEQADATAGLEATAAALASGGESAARSARDLAATSTRIERTADALGGRAVAVGGDARSRAAADALGTIVTAVRPILDVPREHAGRFAALYARAVGADGRIDQLALQRLVPGLKATLAVNRGVFVGVGIVPRPGLLRDQERWLEYWSEGAKGPEQVLFDHDPRSKGFYDYAQAEWFAEPVKRRRPWVTGPFLDEGGTNEHMITLSQPVFAGADEAIGVAAVDLTLGALMRLAGPGLDRIGEPAVLVAQNGRVAAASSGSGYGAGDALPEGLTSWVNGDVAGWRVGEEGLAVARVPALPWRLLLGATRAEATRAA